MSSRNFPVKRFLCLVAFGAMVCFGVQNRANAQTVKADHTTLNIDGISQSSLDKARALRMSLDHASVGQNILDGMNTLQSSDSERYSFSNWQWRNRENPGWQQKVDQFLAWVNSNSDDFDVFMMKFCWIDQDVDFSYYRDQMLALEADYSSKKFVWWTMPITTSDDGDAEKRNTFNTAVRNYCSANDKPLYDLADIESHDLSGAPVSSVGELLDESYASDIGHLNETGAERATKGMWSLMVQLGGSVVPPTGGTSDDGGTGGSQPVGGSSGLAGVGGSNTQTTGGSSSNGGAGGSNTQTTGGRPSKGGSGGLQAQATGGRSSKGGSGGSQRQHTGGNSSAAGSKAQSNGDSSGKAGNGGSNWKASSIGGSMGQFIAGTAGDDASAKSHKSDGCSVAMVGANEHAAAWFTALGLATVFLLRFRRRPA